jgi:DUF1365 family protein
MNSAIYEGTVAHERFKPLAHRFHNKLSMLYLDLDELPQVFDRHPLWSLERRNVASFRRRDYLGDPNTPLGDAVRERVVVHCGFRPSGPIRMLCHVRYWGHVFNPVVFYYCFDEAGQRVQAIVAEITNTPWNERHAYVLDARPFSDASRFEFDKAFHVSPFMDMNLQYDWRFSVPGSDLRVHMTNFDGPVKMFAADLALAQRPLNRLQLSRVLWRFPLMTLQVSTAIYCQALKLRIKGTPFFTHPDKRQAIGTDS